MDGGGALYEIKTDAELLRIPAVVLMTSEADCDLLPSENRRVNAFVTKVVKVNDRCGAMEALGTFWYDLDTLPHENDADE